MAILIQKLEKNNITGVPVGWLTIQDLEKIEQKEQNEKHKELEKSVAHYLPLAAKRVEDLIDLLQRRLNMNIPLSYLSVENSITFHAIMLVSQVNYLSPEMQAAKIIAEKDKVKNQQYDMHYTFSVGSEYMLRNSMTANSYKIKNIPEFEKNLQTELVYLNQAI